MAEDDQRDGAASGSDDQPSFDPDALGVERIGTAGLPNAEATRRAGATLADALDGDSFVGLVGPLGAGKTTLVKGLMRGRGADEAVARSPTYTLLNVYRTTPPVVHVDLYRLSGIDGLESTGYWDYVHADRRDILVEWFDRVTDSWTGEGLIVELAHQQSGRLVTVWASETWRDRASAWLSAIREQ
jgi:tRNA threonylcarbamoyladenosine biosynthesis protein TsaE